MKRIFFVACAAFALTFASCGSKKAADQQATEAEKAVEQTTEQAAEATQATVEEVKEVVNEVLVALQNKLADFKAKVEAAKKADAPALMAEATALKDEVEAAALTDDEKAGLKETFNTIIDIVKNLK